MKLFDLRIFLSREKFSRTSKSHVLTRRRVAAEAAAAGSPVPVQYRSPVRKSSSVGTGLPAITPLQEKKEEDSIDEEI